MMQMPPGMKGDAGFSKDRLHRGPNDEAICTIFSGAGKGGVGIEVARLNAERIVSAVNAQEGR
jgi:hypothetical protein